MKKILLILTILAGVSINSKGQHFIASFGVTHSWGVPAYVNHLVYDDYYGCDWVHTSRVTRGGRVFFDVVLQRGDVFVQVNIGHGGYIHRTRYYDNYPLHDHVCGNSCGYHRSYYNTYYNTCNSHYHHGHNHVVYRRRPVYTYGNGYYRSGHSYSYRNGRYYKKRRYYNNSYEQNHHDDDHHEYRNNRVAHSGSKPQPRIHTSHRNNGSRNSRSDGYSSSRSDRSSRESYSERSDSRSGRSSTRTYPERSGSRSGRGGR